MAVELSFNICTLSNCEGFEFSETTGAYSVSNTTGWGSPNSTTAQGETATLLITDPSDDQWSIDIFNGEDGLPSTSDEFPNTDSTIVYTVTPTDIGQTSSIPDGIYTIKYTVARTTATAFSYSITKNIAFLCNSKACILSMFASVPEKDCSCTGEQLDKAIKGFGYIKAIEAAAKCGNITKANSLLAKLSKLCNTKNCNCK